MRIRSQLRISIVRTQTASLHANNHRREFLSGGACELRILNQIRGALKFERTLPSISLANPREHRSYCLADYRTLRSFTEKNVTSF